MAAINMLSKDTDSLDAKTAPVTSSEPLYGSLRHLDLAVTSEQVVAATELSAFFKVPRGTMKLLGREALKSISVATSMQLFPNFPTEVRQKIFRAYQETVPGELVSLSVIDTGSILIGTAATRPSLLIASHEALIHVGIPTYIPVFRLGGCSVFDPRKDAIHLELISKVTRSNGPHIPYIMWAQSIVAITSLSIEVLNFQDGITWVLDTTRPLVNLANLTVRVKRKIAKEEQRPLSMIINSVDVARTRYEYEHQLIFNGNRFIDFAAMCELGRVLVDGDEFQEVLTMWSRLDMAMRTRPHFPSKVRSVLEWAY